METMQRLADWVHGGDRRCRFYIVPTEYGEASLFRVTLTQFPDGYWSQVDKDLDVAVCAALESAAVRMERGPSHE